MDRIKRNHVYSEIEFHHKFTSSKKKIIQQQEKVHTQNKKCVYTMYIHTYVCFCYTHY